MACKAVGADGSEVEEVVPSGLWDGDGGEYFEGIDGEQVNPPPMNRCSSGRCSSVWPGGDPDIIRSAANGRTVPA